MTTILIYGKEHTFLDEQTGLLFRNSSIHETAALHTHTFYELFLVTQGTALHMINDTIQTLEKGDMVFLRPSDTHTYNFHYSEDFRILNIGFSTAHYESIKTFLHNHNAFHRFESAPLPSTIHITGELFEERVKELTAIGEHMQSKDSSYTVMHAKSILALAFSDLFASWNTSAETDMPVWFKEMLAEMDQLSNLQIGYPRMLELAACSPNHLSRITQKLLNVSPTEYINQKRLEFAVYYLLETNDDILTIAETCGFNNLSHFYHLFHDRYSCSPVKFRKQNRI